VVVEVMLSLLLKRTGAGTNARQQCKEAPETCLHDRRANNAFERSEMTVNFFVALLLDALTTVEE
jgi:hypothetical protein